MSEHETKAFELPSPEETPAEYDRARPTYFGLTPPLIAAGLAAFVFGAAVVLIAAGNVLPGVLLLAAVVLLAVLFAEGARRRSRALGGIARVTVGSWSSAGRRVAALRLEWHRLLRERSRLLHALGAAVHAGDDTAAAVHKQSLVQVDERLAAIATEANEAVERARARTADERLATAPTEIHVEPPG